MIKKCRTCQKDFEAFTTAKNCFNCRKEANRKRKNARERQFYIENRDQILLRHRIYEKSENRKKTYQKYRSTDTYREYAINRYRDLPEEKRKARYSVTNAIRSGKLKRPELCEDCRGAGRIEAHHYKGYSKENWLEIQWLCTRCHKLKDKKEKTRR